MKLKIHITNGYPACKVTKEIEIPDSELEGLNEDERAEVFDDYVVETVWSVVDYWWEEV